jgi:hypothetical protein
MVLNRFLVFHLKILGTSTIMFYVGLNHGKVGRCIVQKQNQKQIWPGPQEGESPTFLSWNSLGDQKYSKQPS